MAPTGCTAEGGTRDSSRRSSGDALPVQAKGQREMASVCPTQSGPSLLIC